MSANKKLPEGTISREKVASLSEAYAEVLAGEIAHDHELIVDAHGTIRWKSNPVIDQLFQLDLIDLNAYWRKLQYGKNNPTSRQFYRDMGYSLFGYWEIFYWEVNNPLASEWNPSK